MVENNGLLTGPELYSAMQRLICEWFGMDANEQTRAIPKLVRDLARLQEAPLAAATRAACHDCAEV
jgi:hypothetical protein